MKFKRILSVLLVVATMLTFFVIPASAEGALTNNSTISETNILVNDSIIMNAVGSGGTGPYTYAYYYKSTSATTWHTLKGYSSDDSAILTLDTVDTYDLCIKVKDSTDTVAKKYFVATVSNGTLSSKSYLSEENIYIGETVTLNGVGIGGTAPYTYAFYYKKSTTTTWSCLQSFQSNNSVPFIPDSIGTYNICIKTHDSLNAEHKLYYQLQVDSQIFSLNASINKSYIELGDSVTITASADDGSAPYDYAFYVRPNGTSHFDCLQAYSSSNSCVFTPEYEGGYILCAKAKDSTTSEMRQFFYLAVGELTAESCYISNQNITAGEMITMVGIGKGGTAPYTYAFYYKLSDSSTWTTAQGFDSNNIKDITLDSAGEYDICIKVKDADNTIKKKYFTATVEEPGFYVHYYNYNDWNNVKIYYTDGQNALVQQPGVDMTPDGDGWYSYKITNQENVEVVFNDGGNSQVPATEMQVNSEIWYRNGIVTSNRPDDILVYFYKPSNWSTPNIYYYASNNDTGPAWPGAEMEEVSDIEELDGWYTYDITKYATANVVFNDGTYQIPIQNPDALEASGVMWYKNGIWCNSETDTDEDGLLDCYELILDTDINDEDTDNDGLPDGYEVNVLYTDPLDTDSDDNNISDAAEDFDDDGLSNLNEYNHGTNPFLEDTDGDTLSDGYEISTNSTDNLYQTDPNSKDTDGDGLDDNEEIDSIYEIDPTDADTDQDGATDKWEIEHGTPYNPCIANDDFSIYVCSEDVSQNDLTATITGDVVPSMNIEFIENNTFINESIPGYLGQAINITSDTNVEGTSLCFEFDSSLNNNGFQPVICYFNENTQTFEMMETTISGNRATTSLEHCSIYALFDRRFIWDFLDIIDTPNPSRWLNTAKPINMDTMHVAIVTDAWGTNNNNIANTTSTVAHAIVENLDDHHTATLVSNQSTLANFSKNATDFSAIDNISAINSLSLYDSINTALQRLNNSNAIHPNLIVILSTDDSASYTSQYDSLINQINNQDIKICIVYVNNMSSNLCNQIASRCGSNCLYNNGIGDLNQYNLSQYITVLKNNNYKNIMMPDTNNDGIIDTYATLFNSNDSTQIRYLSGAEILFDTQNMNRISYNTFQSINEDYDHDGIKNGKEITIFKGSDGKLRAIKNTDLLNPDTDGDGILDGNDSAPNAKGLANGIIGEMSIITAPCEGENIWDGHVFLIYKSYIKDKLDFDGFYDGYQALSDSFTKSSNSVIDLHPSQYISIGLSPLKEGLENAIGSLFSDVEGGSWYNLEMATAQNHLTSENITTYEDNLSLTRQINEEQLKTIIDYFKEHNTYNLYRQNCTTVAVNAWNIAFDDCLNAIEVKMIPVGAIDIKILVYTPRELRKNIIKRQGVEIEIRAILPGCYT